MSRLKKYLSNTIWMIGGRMMKLGLGFVASVVVARYLGPEQFGLLNYSFSLVIMAMVVTVMGQEGVLVRELVKHPKDASRLLGSSIVLQFIGTLFAGGLLYVSSGFLQQDTETEKLILVGALSMIFRPACIIRAYFEASVKASNIALVEIVQAFLSFLLRVMGVLLGAPLVYFAFCLSMEWILMGIGYLILYSFRARRNREIVFTASKETVRHLFAISWPLLLSGATIIIHQQVDRIMIRELLTTEGNAQVGLYSAAVRICMLVIFIPQMIVSSLTAYLVEVYRENKVEYSKRLEIFSDLMNWVGISLSVILSLLAVPIIWIAYGDVYASAATILQVVAWKGFFSATGMATGRQSTVENLQRFAYLRNLLGLAVNIGLNWVLIPRYSAMGAAIATVSSMCVANIFSHILIKPYQHIFKAQLVSITIGWFRLLRLMFALIKKRSA